MNIFFLDKLADVVSLLSSVSTGVKFIQSDIMSQLLARLSSVLLLMGF